MVNCIINSCLSVFTRCFFQANSDDIFVIFLPENKCCDTCTCRDVLTRRCVCFHGEIMKNNKIRTLSGF